MKGAQLICTQTAHWSSACIIFLVYILVAPAGCPCHKLQQVCPVGQSVSTSASLGVKGGKRCLQHPELGRIWHLRPNVYFWMSKWTLKLCFSLHLEPLSLSQQYRSPLTKPLVPCFLYKCQGHQSLLEYFRCLATSMLLGGQVLITDSIMIPRDSEPFLPISVWAHLKINFLESRQWLCTRKLLLFL